MSPTARNTVAALALAGLFAGCGPLTIQTAPGRTRDVHLFYLGAKATAAAPSDSPVESVYGGAISGTFYGTYAIVAEFLDMELKDESELLQSRLYAKLNIPVVPLEHFVMLAGPVAGLAYTDLDDAPGWSVDHTTVIAGAEATFFFTGDGSCGLLANIRWVYADWDLDRPGCAEKPYSALEFSLGAAWEF